ncbi:rhomboid family intramembrane serine protease [Mesorhizobium sp. PUT5]|uniref:rhomboid family intramembrane serine protease n=1 Tax=Mesorhizobium sp. PUT5 TaxID=3454629 RepID=UPI003FA41C0C
MNRPAGSEPAKSEAGDRGAPEPRAPREPVFNMPPVVLAIIALCIGVHLLRVYWLTPDEDFAFLVRTAFIPVRYSGHFEMDVWTFTSPFTYTFLHGGVAHLAVNMVWLAAFGSPLANRFGALRFSLFYLVTGLAAAFFFWAIHPLLPVPLIGASGSISGMMGAAARFGFQIDRSSGRPAFAGAPLPFSQVFRSRAVVAFLGVWMIINLVTGLAGFAPGVEDQIAWEAHIGGFLAGFLGLRLFDRPRRGAALPGT